MAVRQVRASQASGLNGKATISIIIPGTFAGFSYTQSGWAGRRLLAGEAWFSSGSQGDYVTNVILSDPNGVIPVGQQGAFPNYPIIQSRDDMGLASGNRGLWLRPGVKEDLLIAQILPSLIYLPSGLQLSGDFFTTNIGGDTAYVNLWWDDGL